MMAEIRGGEDFYNADYFGIFFAVLLKLAAKSYSHNFAALTKYHRTLKEVADVSEDMQEVLLRTLYSCWKTNHQVVFSTFNIFFVPDDHYSGRQAVENADSRLRRRRSVDFQRRNEGGNGQV